VSCPQHSGKSLFPECLVPSTRGRGDPALREEAPSPCVMPRLSGKPAGPFPHPPPAHPAQFPLLTLTLDLTLTHPTPHPLLTRRRPHPSLPQPALAGQRRCRRRRRRTPPHPTPPNNAHPPRPHPHPPQIHAAAARGDPMRAAWGDPASGSGTTAALCSSRRRPRAPPDGGLDLPPGVALKGSRQYGLEGGE
jgi:hypothetical protein